MDFTIFQNENIWSGQIVTWSRTICFENILLFKLIDLRSCVSEKTMDSSIIRVFLSKVEHIPVGKSLTVFLTDAI